jgi:hypothetical protein
MARGIISWHEVLSDLTAHCVISSRAVRKESDERADMAWRLSLKEQENKAKEQAVRTVPTRFRSELFLGFGDYICDYFHVDNRLLPHFYKKENIRRAKTQVRKFTLENVCTLCRTRY